MCLGVVAANRVKAKIYKVNYKQAVKALLRLRLCHDLTTSKR